MVLFHSRRRQLQAATLSGVTRSDWWLNEKGRKRVLKEWHNIAEYLKRGDIAEIQEDDGAFV